MILSFTSFMSAFLLAILLVPLVNMICQFYGYVDIPNSRKIHVFPISRLGGIAIFICVVGIYPVIFRFVGLSDSLSIILYGTLFAFLIGLMDDLFDFSAKYKLFFQCALGIFVYANGFEIQTLNLGVLGVMDLGYLSMPLTVFWIALMMNAFNMIDGMDGLASSYAMVVFVSFGLLASINHEMSLAVLCFLIAGACLGFFLYNFHPAKIFMGDCGSQSLGFLLSVVSLQTVYSSTQSLVWVPLLFLSYPLIELGVSVIRRAAKEIRAKQKIHIFHLIKKAMSADGDHLHHRLLKKGLTQRKTNLVIFMYTVLCCALGFLLIKMTFAVITAWTGLFMIITVFLIRFLNYEQFDVSRIKSEKDEYLLEKKFARESLIKKVG